MLKCFVGVIVNRHLVMVADNRPDEFVFTNLCSMAKLMPMAEAVATCEELKKENILSAVYPMPDKNLTQQFDYL